MQIWRNKLFLCTGYDESAYKRMQTLVSAALLSLKKDKNIEWLLHRIRKKEDMVYCNIVEHDNNKVTYDFGADVDDITGRFVFDFVNSVLEITKEPDDGMPPIRHIHSMLRVNQENFISGTFKKKMSYEI